MSFNSFNTGFALTNTRNITKLDYGPTRITQVFATYSNTTFHNVKLTFYPPSKNPDELTIIGFDAL